MPKISIIIPIYKAELYLRNCIDSIVQQSYGDWECILVDDGSPDASGKICDEYARKDSRFRVFHKKNGGVSSARNLGLNHAKGEWITFADADDSLNSTAFEFYINATKDDKADIIRSGYSRCFPNGNVDNISCHEVIDITNKNEMLDMMEGSTYFGFLWNSFYRRTIIGDIRFDEDICWCEDHLFSLKCYYNCRLIRYLPNISYNYRINTSNSLSFPQNACMIADVAFKELDIKFLLHGSKENATSETWSIFYKKIYSSICISIRKGGYRGFCKLYAFSEPAFQESKDYPSGNLIKLFFNKRVPLFVRFVLIWSYKIHHK